jgi:hypothetical protein
MRDLLPLRRLLSEIVDAMKLPGLNGSVIKSTIFEDNNGAFATARSIKMTPRTKHIAVKYHFFKSHVTSDRDDNSGITLEKIDANFQKADILTSKGMAPQKFVEMRRLLCGW